MKLSDVLLRDTRANQPAANTVPTGVLYCVTDEGNIIEQSNGASWVDYCPVPVGGDSGLVLVEKKVFTANATSYTFSGLDGNTDGVYKMIAQIKNGTGATRFYTIRPNGATSNISSAYHVAGNAVNSAAADTVWYLCGATASGWGQGEALIYAIQSSHSVSLPRSFQSMSGYTDGVMKVLNCVGLWNETSTNLTSLDVVADASNGIADGSVISLYKFAQS